MQTFFVRAQNHYTCPRIDNAAGDVPRSSISPGRVRVGFRACACPSWALLCCPSSVFGMNMLRRALRPSITLGAGCAAISCLSPPALSQQAEVVATSSKPGSPLHIRFPEHQQQAATPAPPSPPAPSASKASASVGEISTHVICKLGKGSVDGALVRCLYHSDFAASVLSPGWVLVNEAKLSANGGIDGARLERNQLLGEYTTNRQHRLACRAAMCSRSRLILMLVFTSATLYRLGA